MTNHDYHQISQYLRFLILKATHEAGSGHPTSNLSAVDLMVVLYTKYIKFDVNDFHNPANDRLIISKGHASALLYSLAVLADCISEEEFFTYRRFGSPLEGHPTFRFPFAEAATGSLGQGLSIGAGEAWTVRNQVVDLGNSKRETGKDHLSVINNQKANSCNLLPVSCHPFPKVYVLMGDGELAEGSVWEAISWASNHKLSNLIAIIDVNRFGQSDETMLGWDMESYRRRLESFGWGVIIIDGHNYQEIDIAYEKALAHQDGPVAIVAKTIKGKGVSFWEDKNGWHNKMLPIEEYEKAIQTLKTDKPTITISKPNTDHSLYISDLGNLSNVGALLEIGDYDSLVKYPSKLAFGNALVTIGRLYSNLVVLDGDVANSLHTDKFKEAFPDRFLQMYIAEHNMAGVAVGLARRGLLPVINTFAAFLTRCHDQLRMAPLSDVTMIVNGSYVGVSLGLDGPSQMGLEDMAQMRSIYGSTVLYPSDPYQTEKLLFDVVNKINSGNLKGVIYFRTTREPTSVIYDQQTDFSVGSSFLHPSSLSNISNPSELVTIVAAGITLHESLKAQKLLEQEGVHVQVLDCYSVKPIDEKVIIEAVKTSKRIVVVEDHYPEGGLGEAVLSCLSQNNIQISFIHLAVRNLPMSGNASELLYWAGIDTASIIKAIQE